MESFSQDPIGFAAGDANLYRYVGNEPTLYVDPSGLQGHPGSNPRPKPKPKVDEAETIDFDELERRSLENLAPRGRPHGVVGSAFLGGYLGLAESGRAISYPLRWLGMDFSAQDRAIAQMWADLRAPEGTRYQTQCAANTAAFATHSVAASSTIVRLVKVAGGQEFVVIVHRSSGQIPIHTVYQVGSKPLHATGLQLGRLRVVKASSDVMIDAAQTKIVSFRSLVLFPTKAAESGQRAKTCVTAAGNSYVRGWIPFWPF